MVLCASTTFSLNEAPGVPAPIFRWECVGVVGINAGAQLTHLHGIAVRLTAWSATAAKHERSGQHCDTEKPLAQGEMGSVYCCGLPHCTGHT